MNKQKISFFKLCQVILFCGIALPLCAFAMNGRTTYQAKIIKPDGYPLEASSVNFRFTVLDTVGSCTLYSETYSAVDMRSTGGLISFALGNGVRDFPASGTTAVFANVFDNSINSMPCQVPGIYNPLPNDTRRIVMQFNDGLGWQTLPAMTINAVPYAMYANKSNDSRTLNGKADTAFVETTTLANLNCGVNQAIKFNNATFSCIDVPASGSGGITSVTTSGTVLSTGGTASAPVITIQAATLSQDGYLTSLDYAEFKAKLSASSTQIINTLGYTPVSSSTVASQIASSTLVGDVSGNPGSNTVDIVGGKAAAQIAASVDDTLAATTSATADTIVKRNSSGNFTANDIYANAAKINYVDIYKPSTSFNIRLQAPTSLSTNYVLNLPTTSGTTGQVLSTDGAGNLSWINPSTGSVVSVSATAPLASTGGSNPTISITQATSSTDGYLSSTDWNTFNNKQAATSAAIITTLGFTPADDAASGTYAQKANNLSDLTSIATARTNLGLGTLATANSIDLGSASATGIIAEARLQTQSNVTSGTQYTKVTVDGKGRVTSGAQLSSGDVTIALGYTPATSTTLAASFVQKTGDTMTGVLTLKAGTTTNAPLKFTSGTLLSSAQSGTIEYDGSQLYFTDGANIRRAIATNSSQGSFDNTSSISNTSGNITLSPNNITGSVIVNSSQASISSGTGALVVNGGVGIAGSINAGGNLNLTGSATIGQSLQLSSMTSGSLLFAGSSGLVSEDNSRLFWDGANKRLGLGTNSPAQTFSVSGAGYFTGNVGIGTTTPSAKLDIVGSSILANNTAIDPDAFVNRVVAGAIVDGSGWGVSSGLGGNNGQGHSWGMGSNGTDFYMAYSDGASNNSFRSFLRTSVANSRALTLQPDGGNVGVGTTSPDMPLTIRGANTLANLQSTAASSLLYFTPNGYNQWRIGAGNDTVNDFGIRDMTSNAVRFMINSSGNVGIGTTAPAQKLSVVGMIESTSGGIKFPDGTIQTTSAVGGTNNTIVSGWPDAILCNWTTAPSTNDYLIMYIGQVNVGGSRYYFYPDSGYYVYFNADGTYNGATANMSTTGTYACNVSISQKISSGQSFNFVKGPAAQWLQAGTSAYYNAGNVGIGTTSAAAALSVSGGVQIGYDSICNASKAGTIRYNNSTIELCNGSSFVVVSSGSGSASGTSMAAGWPDAISCYASGGDIWVSLYPDYKNSTVRSYANPSGYRMSYSLDGNYNSNNAAMAGYDCLSNAWSISQLYTQNRAFNFVGGSSVTLNGSTSGTQTFATGTAGTALNITSSNGVHTFNIPLASTVSVTGGLISNVDYSAFMNKLTTLDLGSVSATGTLSAARLPAFTGDVSSVSGSNVLTLANSGIVSGTYTKVTVDAKGRIVSGSNLTGTDITNALGYTPAQSGTTGSALGVLAYVQRSDTGELTFTGLIPEDNTIPQITEGSEILAITVTVPAGLNFLYFNINHLNYGETSNHSNLFTVALFRDGQAGTDALAAFAEEGDYANNEGSINTTLRVVAPPAGTYTYRIRAGFSAGSFYLNRGFNSMSSLAGNLNQASLTVLGDASGSAPPSNYWGVASGGINFSSGNVGIGTTSPAQKLSVVGMIESTSGGIKFPDGTIQSTSAVGGTNNSIISGFPDIIKCNVTNPAYGARFLYLNSISFDGLTVGYFEPWGASGVYNAYVFYNLSDGSFNSVGTGYTTHDCNVSIATLYSSGRAFNIAKGTTGQWLEASGSAYRNTGNVGIGTAAPAAKLDVAGEVKFGNTASICNSTNEGQQRYNSTLKQMEYCDASSWRPYGFQQTTTVSCVGGTGCSSSCTATCPAGYKVTGGGGRHTGTSYGALQESYANSLSAWTCTSVPSQTEACTATVTCYAVCAK